MGKRNLAPWLGAIVCGALIQSPVEAGGFFGCFSRRTDCESACQQPCPQCQNCPPKKKHTCCLCPAEPPLAPVGMSFAADPQAQFPDASQQGQDQRFDKLEKDVTRLTLIVEKMLEVQAANGAAPAPAQQQPQQQNGASGAGEATTGTRNRLDPIPPGPIPLSSRAAYPRRTNVASQAVVPASNTAVAR